MATIPFYSMAASENDRLLKSKKIDFNLATGEYGIIRLPRFAFVTDVWVNVKTAFDGTTPSTMTLGFTGNGETADPDGFMDAASTLISSAGIKRATSDAQPWSEGKYFESAGGQITATITKEDSIAGALYVFVRFTLIC